MTRRLSKSPRAARLIPLLALAACQAGAPETAPQPATPRVDPAVVAAREALRREASIDVRTIPERAIAVPPLSVRTADTALAPLAYGLADMLMTDLAQSSQLVVVERSRMDALLREVQMVEAGQVDTAHAPRVGRLIGARELVIGTLNDRGGGEFGIDTRLASTVDGSVTRAVSARAPLDAIFDAEKMLAFRLFEQLGVTLTPAERAAVERRPTGNVSAILAYSRGVRDEAFGRYASAAANFRAAVAADPKFAPAQSRLQQVQTLQAASTGDAAGAGGAKPAPAGTAVSNAVTLAGGAVNPSPVTAVPAGASVTNTQQQQQQQSTVPPTQSTPATVIINVRRP